MKPLKQSTLLAICTELGEANVASILSLEPEALPGLCTGATSVGDDELIALEGALYYRQLNTLAALVSEETGYND